MPLRLDIKKKFAQRSERVKSVDLHPTEPWILASLYSGTVCIWNYQTQTITKSFEVTELPENTLNYALERVWAIGYIKSSRSVAHFLESRGMIEDALEIATDPDYRFELAIQLGRLEIAKEIAEEVQSESKWKQLGELAMSSGKLQLAEDCMKYATDLSGLLLLYSSLGDAEGMSKLASLAKEQGKNNVAFLCLFMLGRLEDCLQLLVESNRIPEAALMARSYLPSKVSEIVALWRKDLSKVNSKAAESLADPEEYPNLFEDWQVARSVEANAVEARGVYSAAENYATQADQPFITLVEAFRNLQVEAEEPLENGDGDHEVAEENVLTPHQ
ncbi:hypothetical protein BRARA_K00704 [Brassica rapa]|uniref:COPA/B TPR domain-containing protein n=1 Tax=Brassica campestris TaxID=3711 RepID=A0A397KX49_BRACM|nr:hypothetical protein BRARA_K00704 [Brassica rapa]